MKPLWSVIRDIAWVFVITQRDERGVPEVRRAGEAPLASAGIDSTIR
jgi:hypothetical protein